MNLRIKVCCISSVGEAKIAVELGADAIGLVAMMPSGPGPIPDELIRQVAASVSPPVATFLLTSETTAEGIIRHYNRTFTNTIQIVDSLSAGTYTQIKESLPAVKIVQVVHVIDQSSVEYALKVSGQVDALLLDSGNPNLSIKELGGTGRVHNWKFSRQICENAGCPVFLAGGLNAGNVRQAIEEVRPYGVDICSGVRTNGLLDIDKLRSFIANVRSAEK
jgi:phosphoribosylanthranilate isomerase